MWLLDADTRDSLPVANSLLFVVCGCVAYRRRYTDGFPVTFSFLSVVGVSPFALLVLRLWFLLLFPLSQSNLYSPLCVSLFRSHTFVASIYSPAFAGL